MSWNVIDPNTPIEEIMDMATRDAEDEDLNNAYTEQEQVWLPKDRIPNPLQNFQVIDTDNTVESMVSHWYLNSYVIGGKYISNHTTLRKYISSQLGIVIPEKEFKEVISRVTETNRYGLSNTEKAEIIQEQSWRLLQQVSSDRGTSQALLDNLLAYAANSGDSIPKDLIKTIQDQLRINMDAGMKQAQVLEKLMSLGFDKKSQESIVSIFNKDEETDKPLTHSEIISIIKTQENDDPLPTEIGAVDFKYSDFTESEDEE